MAGARGRVSGGPYPPPDGFPTWDDYVAAYAATAPGGDALAWAWMSVFDTKPVVYLDKPFWQASAFTGVVGRKGVGKGTMTADLGARCTRGELGPKRNVVWIGSEDSISIDVKPRVLVAGGDPERIAVVKDWLKLPDDIPRLARMIDEVGDVGVLVIDPVGNHISGKNSNAETDVRDAISQLNALADRYELLIVGVRHLSEKEAKNGLLAAILGSSAWVQVPRAVIALVRDLDDPALVHMQVVSGNRLPPGTPGRCFRLEGVELLTDGGPTEVTRAAWEGDSLVDVEALLGQKPDSDESKSERARTLIIETLWRAPGQRMNAEVFDALIAKQAGVSAKTVQNLRSELGKNGRGWLKAIPVRDEENAFQEWHVGLTAAAPEPATSSRPAAVCAEHGATTITSTSHGYRFYACGCRELEDDAANGRQEGDIDR